MTSYPGALFNPNATGIQQIDGSSTVNASDVNIMYDEVGAIEAALGTTPKDRAANWGVGDFVTNTLTYGSVGARIQNVENGAYAANNQLVSKNGGSTITSSAVGTESLIIKARASQTANLLEFQTSGGTVITSINSSGYINVIDGGTA